MVNNRSALNPVSTCCNRQKLLMSSPAPTSSMSESATSVTTSALRNRRRPFGEAAARPPSLSAVCRSNLTAWKAGASPKTTPVSNDIASVKPSTRGVQRDLL